MGSFTASKVGVPGACCLTIYRRGEASTLISRRAKISERTILVVLKVRRFPEYRLEFYSVMAHTELLGRRAQQCRVMVWKLLSA